MSTISAAKPPRRELRYANFDELLADAERSAAGPVQALGNWTPGQIFEHLARSMNRSIDGFEGQAPWIVRWVARTFMKRRLLAGPMKPGFRLPPAAAAVLVPGSTDCTDGLAALRQAVARLKTETHRAPSPFLGPLTREESDRLHLNHAALHMSFLVPQ
ncbi:MAG TPA: DUF1569 domain-containing protein [Pirellulales bacterium]|jgi:hypothetical protein|nr:DUF1569 domain-containing protein [Pirellulales bacterium]